MWIEIQYITLTEQKSELFLSFELRYFVYRLFMFIEMGHPFTYEHTKKGYDVRSIELHLMQLRQIWIL